MFLYTSLTLVTDTVMMLLVRLQLAYYYGHSFQYDIRNKSVTWILFPIVISRKNSRYHNWDSSQHSWSDSAV